MYLPTLVYCLCSCLLAPFGRNTDVQTARQQRLDFMRPPYWRTRCVQNPACLTYLSTNQLCQFVIRLTVVACCTSFHILKANFFKLLQKALHSLPRTPRHKEFVSSNRFFLDYWKGLYRTYHETRDTRNSHPLDFRNFSSPVATVGALGRPFSGRICVSIYWESILCRPCDYRNLRVVFV